MEWEDGRGGKKLEEVGSMGKIGSMENVRKYLIKKYQEKKGNGKMWSMTIWNKGNVKTSGKMEEWKIW